MKVQWLLRICLALLYLHASESFYTRILLCLDVIAGTVNICTVITIHMTECKLFSDVDLCNMRSEIASLKTYHQDMLKNYTLLQTSVKSLENIRHMSASYNLQLKLDIEAMNQDFLILQTMHDTTYNGRTWKNLGSAEAWSDQDNKLRQDLFSWISVTISIIRNVLILCLGVRGVHRWWRPLKKIYDQHEEKFGDVESFKMRAINQTMDGHLDQKCRDICSEILQAVELVGLESVKMSLPRLFENPVQMIETASGTLPANGLEVVFRVADRMMSESCNEENATEADPFNELEKKQLDNFLSTQRLSELRTRPAFFWNQINGKTEKLRLILKKYLMQRNKLTKCEIIKTALAILFLVFAIGSTAYTINQAWKQENRTADVLFENKINVAKAIDTLWKDVKESIPEKAKIIMEIEGPIWNDFKCILKFIQDKTELAPDFFPDMIYRGDVQGDSDNVDCVPVSVLRSGDHFSVTLKNLIGMNISLCNTLHIQESVLQLVKHYRPAIKVSYSILTLMNFVKLQMGNMHSLNEIKVGLLKGCKRNRYTFIEDKSTHGVNHVCPNYTREDIACMVAYCLSKWPSEKLGINTKYLCIELGPYQDKLDASTTCPGTPKLMERDLTRRGRGELRGILRSKKKRQPVQRIRKILANLGTNMTIEHLECEIIKIRKINPTYTMELEKQDGSG